MFCPKCGGKNDEDSGFCIQCGNNLVNDKIIHSDKEDSNSREKATIAIAGIVILLVLILAIFGTRGEKGGAGGQGPGEPSVHNAGGGSSLENEARKIALEYLEPLVVQCDGSYVTVDVDNRGNKGDFMYCRTTYYTRFKNRPTLEIKEYTTEADRLNGITWRGGVIYQFHGPYQKYIKDNDKSGEYFNKWRPWEDIATEAFRLTLTKKNGQWDIDGKGPDDKPVNCSENT